MHPKPLRQRQYTILMSRKGRLKLGSQSIGWYVMAHNICTTFLKLALLYVGYLGFSRQMRQVWKALLLLYNIELSTVYETQVLNELSMVEIAVTCLTVNICSTLYFGRTSIDHGGLGCRRWRIAAQQSQPVARIKAHELLYQRLNICLRGSKGKGFKIAMDRCNIGWRHCNCSHELYE